MKTTLFVQNLKCTGCATTIINKLQQIPYVQEIEVDVLHGAITFEMPENEKIKPILEVLQKAGYPEIGENNNLSTQAKSYISCAIGKLS